MTEYPPGSVEDRETLVEMPSEKLLDYFFFQIRNIWRVDGLYFLGIVKKFFGWLHDPSFVEWVKPGSV